MFGKRTVRQHQDAFGVAVAKAAQQVQQVSPLVIIVRNDFDAQIVFSQLEDYLEKLEHDKRTQYDGDNNYCEEDDDFLDAAIDRTRIMIQHLSLQHSTLIRKM